MPQPQPCQATFAAGLSIFPSLVHNSPPRDGSRRRAGVLLTRSSTNRTAAPLVLGTGGAPGTCHAEELLCQQAVWAPRVSAAVVAPSLRIAHVRRCEWRPSLNNSRRRPPKLSEKSVCIAQFTSFFRVKWNLCRGGRTGLVEHVNVRR